MTKTQERLEGLERVALRSLANKKAIFGICRKLGLLVDPNGDLFDGNLFDKGTREAEKPDKKLNALMDHLGLEFVTKPAAAEKIIVKKSNK